MNTIKKEETCLKISIFVKEIQKILIKKQFPMGYKIAVVGATGLVGQTIIKIIEELNLPVSDLIPVASARSQGKTVRFRGKTIKVVDANTAISKEPKVAIFSAGASASRELAPQFTDAGIIVIDNSSAWRMDENVPLVVPEVNASQILKKHKIIANPNCSTIQMVVALHPLHKAYNLKRVIVSTYQSVTGSGMKGAKQLDDERAGRVANGPYPYQIDLNVIPQGGSFEQNGYSQEELKLVYESRKILGIKDLSVTPTVVRVPVKGGHSESVTAEFAKDFEITNVRDIFSMHDGIRLMDDPFKEVYPMPLYSEGRDEVFIGRLRKDLFQKNTLNMWVVSDNLRKGAATNAVQIAQYIISQKHLAS